jgi:GT2 family glycosyltransferase
MSPPPARLDVTAVIVTCNRLEKLRLTLQATLAQAFARVIVINNASDDGTEAYLRGLEDERLEIVHELVNTGGAGGFERGFSLAVKGEATEWLVCFDDDAFPAPDALDRFTALRPDADVGGVAAAVYFPDGRICPMNRPGMNIFHSPRRLLKAALNRSGTIGLGDAAYVGTEPVSVAFSSFVGLFVRCALVRGTLGLPRADLFIYRDDSLYTLSLTRAGYRLLFAPGVRFVHDCSTPSSGSRVYKPLWKAYYIIRNDMPFFRMLTGPYFLLILPFLMGKFLITVPYYDNPVLFLRLLCTALSDGLRGNFTKLHKDVVRRFS